MKIARRGSSADHGESSIDLDKPSFSWSQSTQTLTIRQARVKDFSGNSRHVYTIHLSSPEIGKLLEALSDAAVANAGEFEKLLEPALKNLIRLEAVASGLKT
jgi:hypothetical protein